MSILLHLSISLKWRCFILLSSELTSGHGVASHRLRRGLPTRPVFEMLGADLRGQRQTRYGLLLRLKVDLPGARSQSCQIRPGQESGDPNHLGWHASDDADADGSEFGHRRPCRADDMGLRRRHWPVHRLGDLVIVCLGFHPPLDGIGLQGGLRRENVLGQHPASRVEPRFLAWGDEPWDARRKPVELPRHRAHRMVAIRSLRSPLRAPSGCHSFAHPQLGHPDEGRPRLRGGEEGAQDLAVRLAEVAHDAGRVEEEPDTMVIHFRIQSDAQCDQVAKLFFNIWQLTWT